MDEIISLSDQALIEKTRDLARIEREATMQILHHLREVERRRLFSDLGYSNLFEYVVNDLHYSESAAQRRITAMRLLKELPELESKIESGRLSLSVISQAQSFFRQEKRADHALSLEEKKEVLSSLEGKSIRQAARQLISLSSAPAEIKPDSVRPISETHSELKFVAPREVVEDLETLRGWFAHSHPDLSLGELVALLARMAIEKLDPAREPKKRKSLPAPAPRGAPEETAAVGRPCRALKREVWRRDRGKCTLCDGRYRLQVDHIIPLALGGETTIQNLRLLCFNCNQREADRKLGREYMERFRVRREARGRTDEFPLFSSASFLAPRDPQR